MEFDFNDFTQFDFKFPDDKQIKEMIEQRLIIKDKKNQYKYEIKEFKEEYIFLYKTMQNNINNLNDYFYYFEQYLEKNCLLNSNIDMNTMSLISKNEEKSESSKVSASTWSKSSSLNKKKIENMKNDAVFFCRSNMVHMDMIINEEGERFKCIEINPKNEKYLKSLSKDKA